MAVQEAVFTRAGIEGVAQYAIELAQRRRGRLVSATKSNGIIHTMPFWDQVVGERVAANPDVTVENVLIDALAARMVLRPDSSRPRRTRRCSSPSTAPRQTSPDRGSPTPSVKSGQLP